MKQLNFRHLYAHWNWRLWVFNVERINDNQMVISIGPLALFVYPRGEWIYT